MTDPVLPVPADNTRVVPWTVVAVSILWFTALETAIRFHLVGLYVAGGFGLLIMVSSIWQWRKQRSTNVAAFATILIVLTSVTGLVFVPAPWPQHAVAVMSFGLLWLVGRQRTRIHDDLRGRTMAFSTAVLVWFGWYSLLSASVYLNLNVAWLVGGAGLMVAAAGLLVWLESGLHFRQSRLGVVALFIFGIELFVVTWWLPTTLLVGSTIATVVSALVIQASRHLWKGHWEAGRSRRYLLIGTTLIVLVLLTARWV